MLGYLSPYWLPNIMNLFNILSRCSPPPSQPHVCLSYTVRDLYIFPLSVTIVFDFFLILYHFIKYILMFMMFKHCMAC